MLFDLDTVSDGPVAQDGYDVCIVGAGAAGITLALSLSDKALRVALCEAGGRDFSVDSQDAYRGRVSGDPYFDLDVTRLRFLGGTTNHWAGWSRPFEDVDFDRGHHGAHYTWPIDNSDLEPYLEEACDILEIPNDFEFEQNQLGHGLRRVKFQFSPPVRFGEKYIEVLSASENIALYLNANLNDLSGENGNVTSAAFVGYTGRELSISAKHFVLAMGGIENSRYLLWFTSKYPGRFFSANTPIGKYWMEHPHFEIGQAVVSTSIPRMSKYYSLAREAQEEAQVLGCGLILETNVVEGTEALIRDLLCVAPGVGRRLASLADKNLVCGVYLRAAWEQAPEMSNEIRLSDEVDRFGIPYVELRWSKGPTERRTIVEAATRFNQWLLEEDLGRIQVSEWLLNNSDYPTNDLLAGNHHMGGTRMSSSPSFGVIDRNCQVFGSRNLFVAGSSVFVTGGYSNPTLPIVQFCLRLADHLRSLV
ncbi:GMC family oxidoreductase [Silicimonas algicola]|uniref:Choline dehydrogenase-like flavoprotein n=1 Tax=Silicimonas algicola TaxID=1826607 RepID=A0A316GDB0_9RHOB|nr:GMC oxidoreductase [Silicimonas algicola]AZQ65922.1 GMC family oxidoreductase [Silicimonas algicola]PWK58205.1 choline dehydrogenase-like flavoprotein [Silicimonas algicola]